ncbi:MAG: HAD family hydrolase, partial [Candidatus Bathyarchaeia archaeon]
RLSVKAISFDLDGVLTYFDQSVEQFYSTVFQELGLRFSAEKVSAAYSNVHKWWRKRFVSGKPRTREGYLEYNHRFLKGLGVEGNLEELSERMQSGIESMLEDLDDRLYPEVKGVLETLRRMGIRLAVVSHRPLALSLRTLEKHSIEEYFNCVVSPEASASIGGKMSLEMWRFTLDKLEVNPDEVLHIDDNYEWISGAKKSGIQPVLIDRKRKSTSTSDCTVIHDLTEVLGLI